ncbi:MAG: glycosyltransferase family 2 protein [Chitinophagaceae bacterium]
MQPFVAIVLLNFNGKKFLEQFVPALLKTNYSNFRIYLIDNASCDNSISFIKKYFPTIECIVLDKNYGFAEGYNQGLKHIEATYFVLLNSDIEVSENWLQPMVSLLEENPIVAACQSKMKDYSKKDYFEYAGAAGGWIDCLGYPFTMGRMLNMIEKDEGQYDIPRSIAWACGAVLMIRSTIYWEVNGMDSFFFAHQEEIDMCWRIQSLGYQIYSCPQSVVYHVGGGTLTTENPYKMFLNVRNNLIMLTKNLPYQRLLYLIPIRLVLDGSFGIVELIKGHYKKTLAIIKGHWGYYHWIYKYLKNKERKHFPKKRSFPTHGFYKKSILFSYYLFKQRKFKDLGM